MHIFVPQLGAGAIAHSWWSHPTSLPSLWPEGFKNRILGNIRFLTRLKGIWSHLKHIKIPGCHFQIWKFSIPEHKKVYLTTAWHKILQMFHTLTYLLTTNLQERDQMTLEVTKWSTHDDLNKRSVIRFKLDAFTRFSQILEVLISAMFERFTRDVWIIPFQRGYDCQ